MKPLKLVCMAMICMAVILASCSGSDGETGPQGKPGIDGSDGTNGVDGTNGNANVQEFMYNLDVFSDYTELTLDLNNYIAEPANYAYLYYISFGEEQEVRISMPGGLGLGGGIYTTVAANYTTSELFIQFFAPDDAPQVIPGELFTHVIVVAIELTNTSKNSESIMAELKSAGVDTSDYNAVAEYFGLE